MTSLAYQLKRLALPQNDPSLLKRSEVASLLFTQSEAASIDRDTFFAIGCTGLEELSGIDSSFEEFNSTLFSQASKDVERSVQSKSVNAQLDESILVFLTRLSPYFMLKPAQKCLEWLIQRFHIHLYNQDSLIGCVLPYHETKVFVRVIQLLKLSDPTHRWHWLEPIQKPGVPLAKNTLINHCYKDMSFMDFICNLVTKAGKAFLDNPGNAAQLRVLFSFYASTIVLALDAVETITDTIIAKLLPYVQKGLKSSWEDYRSATYMIICQLAVKVVMEASLVNTLAQQVSRTLAKKSSLTREGLSCLVILLQNQKRENISKKTFAYLCSVPDLSTVLQDIDAQYNVSPLLHYFLPKLLHSVTAEAAEEQEEHSSCQTRVKLLEAILQSVTLENNLGETLVNVLIDDYISLWTTNDSSSDTPSAFNQKIKPLVRLLETRYPKAYDAALEERLRTIISPREQDVFNQFVSLSLSSAKHQLLADSDTSLLLSLNHPQPAVRNFAVQHLKEIIESSQGGFDDLFLKDSILQRLKDDTPLVVLAALQALKAFSGPLGQEDTVSHILSLFHQVDLTENDQWCSVLEEAIMILSTGGLLDGNEVLTGQVLTELLPYMILTNPDRQSAEQKITVFIANSGLCSLTPLLHGWPEALKDAIECSKSSRLVGEANEKLIQILVTNMCQMEPSTKTWTVEILVQFAEKESSNPRQNLIFSVLSFALVQALEKQPESGSFQIALRVFGFLEKKLRKLITKSEHLEEVSENRCLDSDGGNTSLAQLLTELVKTPQTGNTEPGLILTLLLKNFIVAFEPPISLPKGQTWWNPESLDKQNCDYLRLLIGLFDIIICGSSEGSLVGSFRILMQLLFQTHLPNTNSLFMFLNLLWTYNFNLGNQINCTINAVLQTRALYMGRVLLTDQSAGQRGMLASLSSPVLISLVICLGSPVREVRRGAIGCLQTLMLLRGTVFYQVIDKLVNLGEEIISDHRHLPQVFSSLFEQLLTQSKPNAQNKRLTEALENFMQCIVDPEWPSYIARCLLNTLEEVNGELMMSKLRPLLERFLEKESGTFRKDEALLLHMILRKYNKYSAPFLATHIRSMNFFLSAMNNSKELYRGLPTLQVIALGQITKEFFAALPDGKIQQKLLGVLFDLLVQCKNPACAQLIGNVFKGITVDAEQIAQEFGSLQKPQSQATVQQKRRQKMLQRKSQELQGAEPVPPIDNVYWQRVTLILELMQHKKKLKRPQILIPALFSLLSRCLDPSLSEEASLEYTKQLLLNCLLNLCQKLSPDGTKISKDVLDEEKFNVELIVQCVRGSNVPQTHHHALLLLGTAAGIFPDKVLHNIMPIFTFMGANVMRLDDSYSFKVINNTVKTVIPALIQANDEGSVEIKEHVNKVVTNIIHVFVDALPHVPEHRRLPILSQLIDTVSAERFLWVLLLLLFEQHVTKTSAPANGDKEAILERDVEFWISVCCEFGVQEQLLSLMNMLRYLAKLPEDKEDEGPGNRRSSKTRMKKPGEAELLFNVETHSAKQLRHFKFLSVSFMVQLLASNSFVGKVAESDECEHETLQKLEQSLLEEILCYINVVARCVEENAEKPTAKFWRSLLNRSYDVLDKVNALLPTETFIPVIRGLMSNPLPSVRRKAMDLLNNKLQQHKTAWQDHQVTLLLNLIEDLLSIVSSKEKEEEEQAVNRQTALYSLKLLCKCFGTNQQNPFVPVLTTAVDLITGDSEEERNVLASALLCVAEVTSALKALAIPQLPRLMPGLLKMLRNHKALLSNEIYLLSAVAALQKVTETLPHFISPYLLGILTQITCLTQIASRPSHSSQLNLRLTSLRTTLATKLAPRVLLPAVSKCYNKLVDTNQNCLGPLMLILKENISHMEKEQLNSHQSELTSFFLKALDFRADHLEVDLDKVSEIEGHIINCLIVMVMKLSEITFRPLFFKLFDWSKSEGQPKDRMITFSRLADCIADKLKGLFTLFAGNLVKPFADILNQTNSVKTDEAFFDSKWNTEKSCLLLQFVINCLHKIFLYDTHRFVSKERADALMMPLVDQLENMLGGEEKYKERVVTHVIPCVAQFSVALGDDSLWKPLNYQILLKTRDSLAKVRFSALLMLLELASKLKENYMLLLPEAIPFLAELLEDESEEVENQCQKVIQQLEVILGEPLQSYF
uniref:HEAT repeat-containing protein 1 n=1 Tax=Callorhinchus milii TaxID=7868 RepID=A0A4W3IM56_CALMI|eukprot:gi/632952871/ref/XP_007892093.1/ PREDICTED: HEAT repeat-containing protein 1 isoform X2 [Callorhinchus milii]